MECIDCCLTQDSIDPIKQSGGTEISTIRLDKCYPYKQINELNRMTKWMLTLIYKSENDSRFRLILCHISKSS